MSTESHIRNLALDALSDAPLKDSHAVFKIKVRAIALFLKAAQKSTQRDEEIESTTSSITTDAGIGIVVVPPSEPTSPISVEDDEETGGVSQVVFELPVPPTKNPKIDESIQTIQQYSTQLKEAFDSLPPKSQSDALNSLVESASRTVLLTTDILLAFQAAKNAKPEEVMAEVVTPLTSRLKEAASWVQELQTSRKPFGRFSRRLIDRKAETYKDRIVRFRI